jgi:ubiquinone/menaquinone biosynthesis C-methylase UbiE
MQLSHTQDNSFSPVSPYACPRCKGSLRTFADRYECFGCGRTFPVCEDIPDFRLKVDDAESGFYEDVSFHHHYGFSQRHRCYFRDRDYFADQVGFLLRLRELRTFLNWVYASEEKGLTVLDAGCGDGIMTQFLLREPDQIFTIDLSLSSLKMASKFLLWPNMGTPKSLNYARCNVHALPFFDSFFNVAILTEVLEHTSNPDLVLSEVYRTLKVGGKLYLTTPNVNGGGLLYGRLKRLTRKTGFRLTEKREMYNRIEESEKRYGIKGHVKEFGVDELNLLLAGAGFSNLRSYTRYSSFLDLQVISKLFRGLDRILCASWFTQMYAALDRSISSRRPMQRRGFIQICSAERLK